jgi:hypothetical protein
MYTSKACGEMEVQFNSLLILAVDEVSCQLPAFAGLHPQSAQLIRGWVGPGRWCGCIAEEMNYMSLLEILKNQA